MSNLTVSFIIRAIDQATSVVGRINKTVATMVEPVKKVNRSFGLLSIEAGLPELKNSLRDVGHGMSRVGAEARSLGLKVAAIGGGAAWLIKSQLVDTAAEFEKFYTILETVEGNSEKARKSMQWVSDFAAKTPFELAEVTEAFVKLKAYGMDPIQDDLLRTLGDTGAAMGKPVMQAVEAIADAVTGEYERLKEFGIKAQTKGERVRFAYTDREGRQQYKIADNTNRAMIQAALAAIWNEKYAGAMDKMSKTWKGMVSNIADQWTRFKVMIMEAGVFDWLKDKLEGFLATVDRMAADGSLRRLANDIGVKLRDGLMQAWEAGKHLVAALRAMSGAVVWLAEALGGWQNLMIAIGALMAGKLLFAVVSFIATLQTLGITLAMTPVGWFIAAVAAIAGLALLVVKKWEPIKAFFIALWEGIKQPFAATWDWIAAKIVKLNDMLPQWVKQGTLPGHFFNKLAEAVGPEGKAAPSARPVAPRSTSPAQKADVGGTIKLELLSSHPVRVREMKSNNKAVDFDLDAGLMMASH